MIGRLPFWEAVVAQKPAILAAVHSCVKGNYIPMTMTGIVPKGEGVKTTTELPIAFRIRTPYVCRDGTRLQIMVALGDILVNFVISIG